MKTVLSMDPLYIAALAFKILQLAKNMSLTVADTAHECPYGISCTRAKYLFMNASSCEHNLALLDLILQLFL